MAYDIGDTVRLACAFADIDGDASDPSSVSVTIRKPDGSETSYLYGTDTEVVRAAVGSYYLDYLIDAAGDWWYRWVGGGTMSVAEEGAISVKRRRA